jgi:trigger factor
VMTVQELKTRELPDLDDEFVKELTDGDVETLAQLRSNLTENFQKEVDDKNKQNKETAILNELLNHIEVEIPETLLDRELNFMLNQTAMQLQQQGIDVRQIFTPEMIPSLKERSRPEAIDRIKRTLALGEVAKLEDLKIDEAELATKIRETMAELRGQDIDPNRLREVLTEEMLKDTILAWLEENWTIDLVPEGTLTPAIEESDDDSDDDAIEVEAEVA